MQSLQEKEDAIRSLLPLLLIHLDLLPMRLKAQRLGESIGPQQPLPGWRTLDCDGLCNRCEFGNTCKGEWWAIVKEKLRRRYRLEAINVSMGKLYDDLPQAFRAVVAIYVDPYDERTEPLDEWHRTRRQQWADKGIEYMAEEIPGEVRAFEEKRAPKHLQIRNLIATGYSYRRIAKEVGVSRSTIREVKREMVEA